MTTNTNPWEEIKRTLAARLTGDSYQNWIQPTKLDRLEDGIAWVAVPNTATAEWIEREYATDVEFAIRSQHLPVRRIIYQPPMAPPVPGAGLPAAVPAAATDLFAGAATHLNPKFTFESFVVGSCNQFAHAAAQAVSQNPSKSYNPLFIYGGVGMGKTHLMHAIGRALIDRYPGMNLVYATAERFMNQMITCIKQDRMRDFQAFYRTADILLVDDVQIISGKERTQEEFFHTFNDLFDHQKQIVLSSDQPPKNTPGLVDRLRSRFEWGLLVDVQPPDLETKMAILDKKAEDQGVPLPEDVRIFIATKTKSNVRELEGALVRLIAHSSFIGSPITLEMAQQVLKHLATAHDRRITIDTIIRAVADKWSMPAAALKQKSNERRIAYPRQIAMFLAKELTNASLPEIGRAFGGKHHTTVLHSVQKIEALRQRDAELNREIHGLMDTINA